MTAPVRVSRRLGVAALAGAVAFSLTAAGWMLGAQGSAQTVTAASVGGLGSIAATPALNGTRQANLAWAPATFPAGTPSYAVTGNGGTSLCSPGATASCSTTVPLATHTRVAAYRDGGVPVGLDGVLAKRLVMVAGSADAQLYTGYPDALGVDTDGDLVPLGGSGGSCPASSFQAPVGKTIKSVWLASAAACRALVLATDGTVTATGQGGAPTGMAAALAGKTCVVLRPVLTSGLCVTDAGTVARWGSSDLNINVADLTGRTIVDVTVGTGSSRPYAVALTDAGLVLPWGAPASNAARTFFAAQNAAGRRFTQVVTGGGAVAAVTRQGQIAAAGGGVTAPSGRGFTRVVASHAARPAFVALREDGTAVSFGTGAPDLSALAGKRVVDAVGQGVVGGSAWLFVTDDGAIHHIGDETGSPSYAYGGLTGEHATRALAAHPLVAEVAEPAQATVRADFGSWWKAATEPLTSIPTDDAAPFVTATLAAEPNADGWWQAATTATLTATDAGAGVHQMLWGRDAPASTSGNPAGEAVTLNADGQVLRYRAVDRFGKESATHSLTFRLDTANPAVATTSHTAGVTYCASASCGANDWGTAISGTTSDADSGIRTVTVTLTRNNTECWTTGTTWVTAPNASCAKYGGAGGGGAWDLLVPKTAFAVGTDVPHTVTVTATDRADRTTTATTSFFITKA